MQDINAVEADAVPSAGSWERSVVEIAWRGRRLLIIATAVGLFLGLLYFLLAPRVYESSAVVYIDRPDTNDPSRLKNEGVAAANPVTQASVLKSTPVLTRALNEPGVANSATLADVSDRLAFMRSRLSIRGDEKDETVILSLEAKDPDEAALIINAVLRAYFANHAERLARFTNAVGQPDPDPDASSTPVPEAAPAAALPSFGQTGSQRLTEVLVQGRLAELTARFTQAEANERSARQAIISADEAGDDLDQLIRIAESIGVGDDSTQAVMDPVRSARLAMSFALSRREAFPSQWGPEHPAAKQFSDTTAQLQARLAFTEAAAADKLRRMIGNTGDTAARERQRIADQLDTEQQRAKGLTRLPLELVEEAHPQRKPVSPRGAFTLAIATMAGFMIGMAGLVGRELVRLAKSREALEAETAGTAETGLVVYQPTAGQLPALTSARPSCTITPAAIQSGGEGAPMILGVVPRIAATHRLMAPDYDKAGTSVHHIRAILEALARRQGIRSLGLVSAQRGSGKTSLAMGVASSLALSGTRVLVADCDIAGRLERGQARNRTRPGDRETDPSPQAALVPGDRNRTIDGIAVATGHLDTEDPFVTNGHPNHHHANGETNGHAKRRPPNGTHGTNGNGTNGSNGHHHDDPHTPENPLGIAGVIEGFPVEDCIIPSATPGLAFLPANTAQPGHIGRLSDPLVGRLIEEGTADHDILLVDSGPVPGSVEAMLVAGRVDAVVLILDDRTSMAEYKRMLSYLKVAGATVAGVVFNKAVDPDDPFSQAADPDELTRRSDNPSLDGSGILAASVLTDVESGFSEMDWERIDPDDLVGDFKPTPNGHREKADAEVSSPA
ncbi:MAG: Wzz/FepE/Etk N-terminal domain-containing protein [Planctomycetota bacterium]